jgi:hypothetical protein
VGTPIDGGTTGGSVGTGAFVGGAMVGAAVGGVVGRCVLSSGRDVGAAVVVRGVGVAVGAFVETTGAGVASRGLAVASRGLAVVFVAGLGMADGDVEGTTNGNPGKSPTRLAPVASLLRLNAANATATAIDGPSKT